MRDARANGLVVMGVVTGLFFASRSVLPGSLPPLAPVPDFGTMVPEPGPNSKLATALDEFFRSKGIGPLGSRTEQVASLQRAFIVQVVLRWLLIAGGIAAGVLLMLGHRAGRWLALVLYAWLLGWSLFERGQFIAVAGWPNSLRIWSMMGHMNPRWVVSEILDIAVSTLTLAYLARHSFAVNERRPLDAGRTA